MVSYSPGGTTPKSRFVSHGFLCRVTVQKCDWLLRLVLPTPVGGSHYAPMLPSLSPYLCAGFFLAERQWNMWIPGFGSEEIRPYKKACTTEAHKQVRSSQSPRAARADLLSRVSAAVTAVVTGPTQQAPLWTKDQRGHGGVGLHWRWVRYFRGTLLFPHGVSVFPLGSDGHHLELLILGSSNMDEPCPFHIS